MELPDVLWFILGLAAGALIFIVWYVLYGNEPAPRPLLGSVHVKDDEQDGPYLFLELAIDPDEIGRYSGQEMVCQIDAEDFTQKTQTL